MRALTVVSGQPGSLAVTDVPDPPASDGDIVVDGVALGVCGTDREIARGEYGWAPPGHDRLMGSHDRFSSVRTAPR